MRLELYEFKSRGTGVITLDPISSHTRIGEYLVKGKSPNLQSRYIFDGWVETYPLGRYLNHSIFPNLRMELIGKSLVLFSNENISKLTELTVDYLNVISILKIPENIIDPNTISKFEYEIETIEVEKQVI